MPIDINEIKGYLMELPHNKIIKVAGVEYITCVHQYTHSWSRLGGPVHSVHDMAIKIQDYFNAEQEKSNAERDRA